MREHYDLLKKMESRPQLWTGDIRLKSIRTFLDGYSYALYENNLNNSTNSEELNFHDWVANKLGFNESTAGWHNMILAVTMGLDPKKMEWKNYDSEVTVNEHKESIKLFYKLLEEYIQN